MTSAAPSQPDWSLIDTVLLDMDGTLLDLAFDTHLWRNMVPAAYGAARSLTPEQAREALIPRFRAREGTLDWYCIEYWSRELELDVATLHRDHAARIAWLPGAEQALERLKARGKRLVLLTNAHPWTLEIKNEFTGLTRHFDAVFTSHDLGAPKESAQFWQAVRAVEPFDPQRTLFIDDSAPVLRAARAAGIRWIYAIRRPDSTGAPRQHVDFLVLDSVAALL